MPLEAARDRRGARAAEDVLFRLEHRVFGGRHARSPGPGPKFRATAGCARTDRDHDLAQAFDRIEAVQLRLAPSLPADGSEALMDEAAQEVRG